MSKLGRENPSEPFATLYNFYEAETFDIKLFFDRNEEGKEEEESLFSQLREVNAE